MDGDNVIPLRPGSPGMVIPGLPALPAGVVELLEVLVRMRHGYALSVTDAQEFVIAVLENYRGTGAPLPFVLQAQLRGVGFKLEKRATGVFGATRTFLLVVKTGGRRGH